MLSSILKTVESVFFKLDINKYLDVPLYNPLMRLITSYRTLFLFIYTFCIIKITINSRHAVL